MTAGRFSSRPFTIPPQIVSEAQDALRADKKLTPVMHDHKNALGDYDLARSWLNTLTRQFNWIGMTMNFNVVLDYHLREKSGKVRYRQTMFEQDGVPAGYSRVLNLSKDTQTRRIDCAKIEETLVSGQPHIADTSLLKFMHEAIAADSAAQGKKRLITELGVGFSPKRYNSVARQIAMLSRTPGQEREVARLRRMFNRDWVGVTVDFARKMGFEVTDIALPAVTDIEINPQLRVSQTLGPEKPLPLPPMVFTGRECFRYADENSLKPVRDYMSKIRAAAAKKYDIK